MTKIYLVWYYCYSDSYVAGVFDSIEKAKELKAKLDGGIDCIWHNYGIEVHELNKEDDGEFYDDNTDTN